MGLTRRLIELFSYAQKKAKGKEEYAPFVILCGA